MTDRRQSEIINRIRRKVLQVVAGEGDKLEEVKLPAESAGVMLLMGVGAAFVRCALMMGHDRSSIRPVFNLIWDHEEKIPPPALRGPVS